MVEVALAMLCNRHVRLHHICMYLWVIRGIEF